MINDNTLPKIGIVSGIGPLAGADVLTKLFACAARKYGAVQDCEYPDVVLVNHGIKGVDDLGTLNNDFEEAIISMIDQLEDNGATIIGIACNTAHVYIDKIKCKETTTLVNLIDEVSLVASKHKKTYLLLTSEANKAEGLYPTYLEKHNVDFAVPSDELQTLVTMTIKHIMAHELKEAGEMIQKVLKKAKEDGFGAVIAGCTELPIAIAQMETDAEMLIIESNSVLAEALMDSYMI